MGALHCREGVALKSLGVGRFGKRVHDCRKSSSLVLRACTKSLSPVVVPPQWHPEEGREGKARPREGWRLESNLGHTKESQAWKRHPQFRRVAVLGTDSPQLILGECKDKYVAIVSTVVETASALDMFDRVIRTIGGVVRAGSCHSWLGQTLRKLV